MVQYTGNRSPRFASYLLLAGRGFFPFVCYQKICRENAMSKYTECQVYEVTLLQSIEYANKLVR